MRGSFLSAALTLPRIPDLRVVPDDPRAREHADAGCPALKKRICGLEGLLDVRDIHLHDRVPDLTPAGLSRRPGDDDLVQAENLLCELEVGHGRSADRDGDLLRGTLQPDALHAELVRPDRNVHDQVATRRTAQGALGQTGQEDLRSVHRAQRLRLDDLAGHRARGLGLGLERRWRDESEAEGKNGPAPPPKPLPGRTLTIRSNHAHLLRKRCSLGSHSIGE